MEFLTKFRGGSHSYGLNTPQSDLDNRGVFLNTDMRHILGLQKHEHQENTKDGADDKYRELRRFLHLLKNGNSESVEALFNENLDYSTQFFDDMQRNRLRLMDSERLFQCLKGYMAGELQLANGGRKGEEGGKRREAIDKYGFSPRNFVQLLRLAFSGRIFFKTGVFPVNVFRADAEYGLLLMRIKVTPARFQVSELNAMAKQAELRLIEAFESRTENFEFDEAYADELVFSAYYPFIQNHYLSRQV